MSAASVVVVKLVVTPAAAAIFGLATTWPLAFLTSSSYVTGNVANVPLTLFHEKITVPCPAGKVKLLIGATSVGAPIFSVEPSGAAPVEPSSDAFGETGLDDLPHATPSAIADT